MYTYVYICIHLYTHVYIHTHLHAYITYMHACIYRCEPPSPCCGVVVVWSGRSIGLGWLRVGLGLALVHWWGPQAPLRVLLLDICFREPNRDAGRSEAPVFIGGGCWDRSCTAHYSWTIINHIWFGYAQKLWKWVPDQRNLMWELRVRCPELHGYWGKFSWAQFGEKASWLKM